MSRVLILPGRDNSGPTHWQSRWQATLPACIRIEQREWAKPARADWVESLQRTVTALAPAPVVLVAHSLACSLVAHWGSLGTSGTVIGALLVAPSDVDAIDYPPGPVGFSPMPLARLPFPTIVVASTDDPRVSEARARAFAHAWGSEYRCIGAAGHINSDSGLGEWPAGLALVDRLAARAVGQETCAPDTVGAR
ncbi:MAG: alpha/beta hydrolase [Proteobacteria bacterium]|nr:alpha/beta hydrolase [Burkholderiales bacterium]